MSIGNYDEKKRACQTCEVSKLCKKITTEEASGVKTILDKMENDVIESLETTPAEMFKLAALNEYRLAELSEDEIPKGRHYACAQALYYLFKVKQAMDQMALDTSIPKGVTKQ